MRFTYALALIIAATLHASGTSLPATKDSKATIEKIALPAIAVAADVDGGRQLRRVDKNTEEEDEIEEERFLNKLGKWVQKQATNWKASRQADKLAKHKARADRMADNIRLSNGIPGFGS